MACLLRYLKSAFGDAMTDDCANAWRKLFDVVIEVVGKELERLAAEELKAKSGARA